MALPATDSFTGTNGTSLPTYNASWTVKFGGFDIQGNTLAQNSVAYNLAYWNADAFADDQYSQCVFTNGGTGPYAGLAVRVSAAANTGYAVIWSTGDLAYIAKFVASTTPTTLGSPVASPSVGQVVKLSVSGTTISLYYDGALQTTRTDSDIASGSAGVSGYSDDSAAEVIDSWEGGNLAGATIDPGVITGSATTFGLPGFYLG